MNLDLIDVLRWQARVENRILDTELNGVPVQVAPDGTVTVRWETDHGGPDDERHRSNP